MRQFSIRCSASTKDEKKEQAEQKLLSSSDLLSQAAALEAEAEAGAADACGPAWRRWLAEEEEARRGARCWKDQGYEEEEEEG